MELCCQIEKMQMKQGTVTHVKNRINRGGDIFDPW
jgi:hypothetical protein